MRHESKQEAFGGGLNWSRPPSPPRPNNGEHCCWFSPETLDQVTPPLAASFLCPPMLLASRTSIEALKGATPDMFATLPVTMSLALKGPLMLLLLPALPLPLALPLPMLLLLLLPAQASSLMATSLSGSLEPIQVGMRSLCGGLGPLSLEGLLTFKANLSGLLVPNQVGCSVSFAELGECV